MKFYYRPNLTWTFATVNEYGVPNIQAGMKYIIAKDEQDKWFIYDELGQFTPYVNTSSFNRSIEDGYWKEQLDPFLKFEYYVPDSTKKCFRFSEYSVDSDFNPKGFNGMQYVVAKDQNGKWYRFDERNILHPCKEGDVIEFAFQARVDTGLWVKTNKAFERIVK